LRGPSAIAPGVRCSNWSTGPIRPLRGSRLTPSVSARRRADRPPPARSAGGGKAPVVFLLRAKRGGGGSMRSIETEGVLFQLALHACRPSLCEAFEVVEQCGHAAEAGDDLGEGSGAAWFGRRDARGVGVRQAQNLPCALVDQQMDAVFQDGDVGVEFRAQVGRVADRLPADRIFEAADDGVDVVARDLSQPRDGVEREQDAQEGDQQIDHGRDYKAGAGRRRFCGALSSILVGQYVETAREGFWPSCEFGMAPSPILDVHRRHPRA
jgi:hypothetical protein